MLSGLVNLQRLDVSNTPVIDLSPLSGLANLRVINLMETQVSDLSRLLELIKNLI